MRKIILNSLSIFLSLSLFVSCSDDDDDIRIEPSELPKAAQNFVNTHFGTATYRYAEKDKKPAINGALYDVYLTNGFKLEFDINGAWVEVDGEYQEVPASVLALVPENIPSYVKQTFPTQYIVSIEKKTYGFKVELISDLDLIFNSGGIFVSIDR